MNQFLASNSHLFRWHVYFAKKIGQKRSILREIRAQTFYYPLYGVATAYSTNENPSTDKLSRAINYLHREHPFGNVWFSSTSRASTSVLTFTFVEAVFEADRVADPVRWAWTRAIHHHSALTQPNINMYLCKSQMYFSFFKLFISIWLETFCLIFIFSKSWCSVILSQNDSPK